MKFFKVICALVLCLGFPAVAAADTIIPDASLAPLAAWVGKTIHVNMDVLPSATVSEDKLEMALRLEDAQKAGAIGAYLPGRIYISPLAGDLDTLNAQSYIVHELVHHAQLISGRTYPCHAAKEREAYTLQNQWLTEHGQKPAVNQNWINQMSVCPASDNSN